MKKQEVAIYLCLRPRTQYVHNTIREVKNLISLHPGASVDIVGMSGHSDRFYIVLEMLVQHSNTEPSSISTLDFAFKVFETMFDAHPMYCASPTDEERELAEYVMHQIAVREHSAEMDNPLFLQDIVVSEPSNREGSVHENA